MSSETFTSIVNSLRSDERDADEKRAKPRVGLSGKALVQDVEGNLTAVVVRDLSQTGMGIIRHQPLDVRSRSTLCFAKTGSDPANGIICEVMRSQRVADGLYTVGVRFIQHVELAPKQRQPAQAAHAR